MATRCSILSLSQWWVGRVCDWALLVLMTELSSSPSHSPCREEECFLLPYLEKFFWVRFLLFSEHAEMCTGAVAQVPSTLNSLLGSMSARQVARGGLCGLCCAGITAVRAWRARAALGTAGGRTRPAVLQTRGSSGSFQRRTCPRAKEAPGKWGTLLQG